MTNQEIFDTVAEALMVQGRPSTNPDGGCAYINPNGDRCAIGWLVSKDEAKKLEEGYSGLGIVDLVIAGYFEGCNQRLLGALQDCHDTYSNEPFWYDSWKITMIDIAENYNLDSQVLSN